jgi:hypothetical protein
MTTYATVEFPSDRSNAADLTDDGWKLRGADVPEMGEILDRAASPADFGPADGDPVACAADAAAQLLGGTVAFVREPEEVPADAVY